MADWTTGDARFFATSARVTRVSASSCSRSSPIPCARCSLGSAVTAALRRVTQRRGRRRRTATRSEVLGRFAPSTRVVSRVPSSRRRKSVAHRYGSAERRTQPAGRVGRRASRPPVDCRAAHAAPGPRLATRIRARARARVRHRAAGTRRSDSAHRPSLDAEGGRRARSAMANRPCSRNEGTDARVVTGPRSTPPPLIESAVESLDSRISERSVLLTSSVRRTRATAVSTPRPGCGCSRGVRWLDRRRDVAGAPGHRARSRSRQLPIPVRSRRRLRCGRPRASLHHRASRA